MHLARAVTGVIPAEAARRGDAADPGAEGPALRAMMERGTSFKFRYTVDEADTAAALKPITGDDFPPCSRRPSASPCSSSPPDTCSRLSAAEASFRWAWSST